jgi:uncharacterized protein with GYD domain
MRFVVISRLTDEGAERFRTSRKGLRRLTRNLRRMELRS